MRLTEHTDALHELVDAGEEAQELVSGLGFTEGPVWDHANDCLLFHDVPGDARYRWSEAGGRAQVASPTGKAIGMAFDAQGRLLICHHATSRVTRLEPDGTTTVLATEYRGDGLNSPNDLVVRSDGLIYFSDPHYGRVDPDHGLPRPMELDHRGVYALDPDSRELRLLAEDFEAPNGLCFSLDESVLFVNDSERWHVRRFAVAPDGSLSGGDVIITTDKPHLGPGNPDGMKLDAEGNVWVSGPGGIWVVTPEGEHVGVVCFPKQAVNFTWGAPNDLYVCATDSVYRVRTKVRGAR